MAQSNGTTADHVAYDGRAKGTTSHSTPRKSGALGGLIADGEDYQDAYEAEGEDGAMDAFGTGKEPRTARPRSMEQNETL